MKILITGTSGFIGGKTLEILREQFKDDNIIALSSVEIEGVKTVLHNNYNFDENYLKENGCSDADVLIHIGAFIPKNSSDVNDVKKNNSNILNTQKLLFSLDSLKKIVFISTVDVYKASVVTTENTDILPISLYGWSKLYCEKMVEQYALSKNIIFQILRLGHVFGPGEEKYTKILPLTIKKVLNNELVEIWGDGEAIRTFIYINDVAKAIVNSIKLENSNIINIVGEEQITINQLVENIINISGKDIKIKHIPTSIPNRNLIFNNLRLKELLLSNLVTFHEGLAEEYKYMKEKNENFF